MTSRCDLLVVGGGTAGIVGAKTAAGLGARVVLIEQARTGGDCLWTGCVPSKALLAAAKAAHDARSAQRLGVSSGPVQVDFAAVSAHVQAAIAQLEPTDSPQALRSAGVEVHSATARFVGPRSVELNDRGVLDFRAALIATGSAPELPPVPGLDGIDALTSETIWARRTLPGALLVLGGGPIGCELGQAFARLGSRVTIVERQARLLGAEEEVAAGFVADALRADGVELRLGLDAASFDADGATLTDGTRLRYDAVLVATGRRARTAGLGLESAGVDVDQAGNVVVDASLRTTNRAIWAAGDVTGAPLFTHVAGVHASAAASNAVLGLSRKAEVVVPRVTFTDPEVASVGTSPSEATSDSGLHVRTIEHADLDRAVAEGRTAGSTRLVFDTRGRVVGASIVGARAGEALAEVTLAIRAGLTARDLAGAMHAYPTYADGPWNAAIADVRAQLDGRAARIGLRFLRWGQRLRR